MTKSPLFVTSLAMAKPSKTSIRSFTPADSVTPITQLLHRAYKRLGDLGLRYNATWQDDDLTLERVQRGEGFVAYMEDALVGTIVYENAATTRSCPWFDRANVASFHQFAVDPDYQGLGIGGQLMDFVEDRARRDGACELALDTAEWAYHLLAMYFARGYRFIENVQWHSVNYQSVILSKDLQKSAEKPPVFTPFLRDIPSEELLAATRELERNVGAMVDRRERALTYARIGDNRRILGDTKAALVALETAMVEAVKENAPKLLRNIRLRTAIAYQYAHHHELALFIFSQVLRDCPRDDDLRSYAHQHLGKCLAEMGQLGEARQNFEKALLQRTDPQLQQSTRTAMESLNLLARRG